MLGEEVDGKGQRGLHVPLHIGAGEVATHHPAMGLGRELHTVTVRYLGLEGCHGAAARLQGQHHTTVLRNTKASHRIHKGQGCFRMTTNRAPEQ